MPHKCHSVACSRDTDEHKTSASIYSWLFRAHARRSKYLGDASPIRSKFNSGAVTRVRDDSATAQNTIGTCRGVRRKSDKKWGDSGGGAARAHRDGDDFRCGTFTNTDFSYHLHSVKFTRISYKKLASRSLPPAGFWDCGALNCARGTAPAAAVSTVGACACARARRAD
ncbi:hypothetical protein EVAR_80456_1 [Eumeta japonica]|uniref:Uncharacterized protein n=1 Tax=Eumeta variegata TaxID=151549 RepID=A0A4C1VHV7_EUMVA|nr:hypothetical protein EVAR_80456_1 [Eumeta japonica]